MAPPASPKIKLEGRPQKITFGDMRNMGVRGLLIYCSDYKCSHLVALSGDLWFRSVCSACGKRGADVRPDFNLNKTPVAMMGYR